MVSPDKIDRRIVRRRQLRSTNLNDLVRDPHYAPVPARPFLINAVCAGASSLPRLPAENLLKLEPIIAIYLMAACHQRSA